MAFDWAGARQAGYSDAEIAQYLADEKKFDLKAAKEAGYEDTEIIDHLTKGAEKPKVKERTMGDETERQLGLTGRAAVKGIMGIPTLFGNALYGGINATSNALGFGYPIKDSASGYLEQGLDRVFPKPENSTERVVEDVGSAIAGAGGTAFAAHRLAGLPQAARKFFTDDLTAQVNAGVAGAGAASLAREGGLSPQSQLGIGLLAGTVAPSAQTVGTSVAKVPISLATQFTRGGREDIVGSALNYFSESPQNTLDRLRTGFPTHVEGSVPTVGQAAGDRGLMAAENFAAGLSPSTRAKFANAHTSNNAARMTLLEGVAGRDKRDITDAISDRTRVTKPMREDAFNNSTQEPNLGIIDDEIVRVLNGEGGSRKVVKDAMSWVRDEMAAQGGRLADPRNLYAFRQDVADLIGGKYNKEGAAYSFAKKELNQVLKAIDRSIEGSAAGYREYMKTYAGMSRPINRMEGAQDLRYRSTDTVIDEKSGFPSLSQPKWEQNLGKLLEDDQFVKSLDPKHLEALTKISLDLNREAQSSMRAMRLKGSDTMSNLSTFGALTRVIGAADADNPAIQSFANKFSWLFKLTDREVNDLLADALLDPKLAQRLMQKANTMNAQSVSNILKSRATTLGYGQTSGAWGN